MLFLGAEHFAVDIAQLVAQRKPFDKSKLLAFRVSEFFAIRKPEFVSEQHPKLDTNRKSKHLANERSKFAPECTPDMESQ